LKGRRAWGGALCALVASCAPKHAALTKSETATLAQRASTVTPSTPASAAPAATSCSTAPTPALSEAAVKELVADWRKAQKDRDFPGYSARYAERFMGLVARSEAFARLDRSAWLRAHEASLALDPSLANATARIAMGAGGARVIFERRSVQSSIAPLPELFVVATGSGAKITREAPARSAPAQLSPNPGLWLADERFAILSTAPDAAWAEGTPSFSGDNSASSAVALARLPKALRAWLGRPVRVLGESGTVCETRLQRFAIRARISPDLPTAELWEGCNDAPGPTPVAIARDIWELSAASGRSLVAEFSAPCKGALFAVDPDLAAPVIAAPEPAPAELGAAALAAFRELPAYGRIQDRFKSESPDAEGAWEDKGGQRSVWSLALPGRPRLLFVSVEAGSGCAHFSASLSALWEVHQDGATATLTLLAVPSTEDDKKLTPRALVDLGASGGPALLLGPDGAYQTRSLLSKTEGIYRRALLTSVPFFGGPC
jgi:hypothetical protein